MNAGLSNFFFMASINHNLQGTNGFSEFYTIMLIKINSNVCMLITLFKRKGIQMNEDVDFKGQPYEDKVSSRFVDTIF